MGLSLKDLGRGLGAGMQVYGAGMQNEDAAAENKRRYDEQQAIREKELDETSRMNDMKIKEMEQTIEINKFKKYQQEGLRYQQQINQGINVSQYDGQYMVGINNKFNPTGTQLRIVQNKDPNDKSITYEMGVIRPKEDGSGDAIGEDGKKIIDWSGARTKTYANKGSNEHMDFWSSQAHPDFTSSERMAGLSAKRKLGELKAAAEQQKEFNIREEKRIAKTPMGVAKLAKIKSEQVLNKATSGLRDAQATAAGKEKSNSQIPIREFEAVNRKWDDVTSREQSDDINYFMSRENLKNRTALLLDYAEGHITAEDVRTHMAKSGITSQKFIQDVLDNADDIAETKKDNKQSGFMKWWSN
jgi:hypothetical protein